MKLVKTLLATAVALMVTSTAFAADVSRIEAYAHPTMFGSQIQSTQGEGVYLVGDKVLKTDDVMTVQEKENVLIDSKARNLLSKLESLIGKFDPKKPVLRSEMAHAMAEGLNLPAVSAKYRYKDVKGSWAESYIYRALGANVMIGYPDKNFRPNQQITKAEVFATLAQLLTNKVDTKTGLDKLANKYEMKEIPTWAVLPTKKVMKAGILNNLPDLGKVASEKYLTTEQLYKLVCALSYNKYYNPKFINAGVKTSSMKVRLSERVDARHANIGDTFYAVTKSEARVAGQCFAEGSKVKGEVVEVVRPGVKNPGYVKVRFVSIQNGNTKVDFPINVANVSADNVKTTNVVARVLGAPFSATGRVAGVAGRTVSSAATVVSNGTERLGDNLSNTFANTASLEPMAGLRSFGKGFVTIGYGIYDVAKLAVSGSFGVLYEFGDEVRYLILPSSVNDSALNVGDELTIVY